MKIFKQDKLRETRHLIEIVINEKIDMSLPDEDGALVSVEHNCAVKSLKEEEAGPKDLNPEDLLDILVNLAVGTILNSEHSPMHKFQAAILIGKSIVTSVANGIRPLSGVVEEMKDDLTPEQKAALELSMSAPSFKAPVS